MSGPSGVQEEQTHNLMNKTGAVFNIQRFSIHDGPGIRTAVFLKGCALSCFWCHNPEGRRTSPELQFFPDRCMACRACVEACPHSAHEFIGDVHIFHREQCETTGSCVDTCYGQALQLNGEIMTVEQVMEEVLRDRAFYENSGGGVTLSGGEPLLNNGFAFAILEQCKLHRLSTAIETCGECPWESLERLLPVTDLLMMDIKHIAPDKHRSATGKSNERILENARRLALTDKPIVFRTPVVPTVNDSSDDIGQIAAFVRTLMELRSAQANGQVSAGITYELLTFHRLASAKYRSLGLEYRASAIEPPSKERMLELAEVATRLGVETGFR
jgi:pyruvate formate lyase activating enzyme